MGVCVCGWEVWVCVGGGDVWMCVGVSKGMIDGIPSHVCMYVYVCMCMYVCMYV